MGLRDFTLFDMLSRNARLHGRRTAFVCGGERVSHRDHLERVLRTAAALARLGVGPGERVAVVSDNSLAMVELFGAALRLGAIFVPLNTRLSPEESIATLADADPRLVLVEPKHEALVAGARASLGSALHWLRLGSGGSGDAFMPAGEGAGELPDVDLTADTPCAMIYTAAVAGRPRGAVISQGNLLASATQVGLSWQLTPADVNLGLLPLFHIAGLLLAVAVQAAGGASLLMPRFEPEAALRAVAEERATLFASFPPILATLLDKAGDGEADLSSLRLATGLDSPETIGRLEAACPTARFWSTYGQAELSGLATLAPFRERPGSAGRPNPGVEMAIVDEADRPVPIGQAGDIVVRGPSVFQGYWRQDEATADTFRGGWHHTGDMGRFDDDGYLWYAGRSPAKDLIKSGGENVYPAEVEAALRAHPAIAEAVVIGVPDPHWGEAVRAVCERRPGTAAAPDEVIAFVGERIARYKRPRQVVFVDELPRSPAGALDRLRIKAEHGA